MDSHELTGWQALFQVHAEEDEHRKDLLDSGDGQVIVSGRDDRDEDSDDDGQAD